MTEAEAGEPTTEAVHADDLVPGSVLELGSHTLTESEIIEFAGRWDPQFFHVDPVRATEEGHYGGLIASGLHTIAIYQRLSVLSRTGRWRAIAGRGLDDVRFRRPVRPGDTLAARALVEDVRLEPDRHRGLVTLAGELVNQHGKQVLGLRMSVYLETRPA